jgi:hypothetical protein
MTDGEFVLSGLSGMAVDDDGSGVYIVGATQDQKEALTMGGEPFPPEPFLKRFDYNGNELSSLDAPPFEDVAVDSSQIYVVGLTQGEPATQLDVFLRIHSTS